MNLLGLIILLKLKLFVVVSATPPEYIVIVLSTFRSYSAENFDENCFTVLGSISRGDGTDFVQGGPK